MDIEELKVKLETKKEIYKENIKRLCIREVDSEYFTKRAMHFGKKAPEYHTNMKSVNELEAEMFWDKMLLKTIKKQIKEEEAAIKIAEEKQIAEALSIKKEQNDKPSTV